MDEFSDTYSGERAKLLVDGTIDGDLGEPSILKATLNVPFVEVSLPQFYHSGPNQNIRKQTIRSRRYGNVSKIQITPINP